MPPQAVRLRFSTGSSSAADWDLLGERWAASGCLFGHIGHPYLRSPRRAHRLRRSVSVAALIETTELHNASKEKYQHVEEAHCGSW